MYRRSHFTSVLARAVALGVLWTGATMIQPGTAPLGAQASNDPDPLLTQELRVLVVVGFSQALVDVYVYVDLARGMAALACPAQA